MSSPKVTKLSIREDRPTALSSSAHGSNLDAIGFNIFFLAARNPRLAVEIMKLYTRARAVQPDDPAAPDEDFALFAGEVTELLANNADD